VVGVVVEPIQSEGGDYHGSPTYFQRLQKLTKQVKKFITIEDNKQD
jgi:4-aminobutyrate aminotransferase-like enzyme